MNAQKYGTKCALPQRMPSPGLSAKPVNSNLPARPLGETLGQTCLPDVPAKRACQTCRRASCHTSRSISWPPHGRKRSASQPKLVGRMAGKTTKKGRIVIGYGLFACATGNRWCCVGFFQAKRVWRLAERSRLTRRRSMEEFSGTSRCRVAARLPSCCDRRTVPRRFGHSVRCYLCPVWLRLGISKSRAKKC